MNKLLYIFYFIVILLIIFLIFSFFNNKYSFSIVNTDVSLTLGTNYIPDLIPNNIEYNDYSNYDWSSQDENIVTVDSLGNIKAISSGKTRIKVKSKKGFNVKFININVLTEEVKSLTFKDYNISLNIGDVYKLEPYINGEKKVITDLSYSISDSSIVSIDKNGIINALEIGTTKILVSTPNGVTSELNINVLQKNIEIESIRFDSEKIFVEKGKSMTLNINIKPIDATNKTVTWKSSNPDVASVNDGVVTALSEGTTTITVATVNGKNAECVVHVINQKISPASISMEFEKLSMEYNQMINLNVNFSPSNTTERQVTWKSSNPNVASVNNGVITALSEGTTKIIATTANGKSATCVVTVKKVEATSISINKTSVTLYIGGSDTLVTNINPSNATNKTVTWKSSNPNVASVNNGVITALSEGTTKIIATTANGKSATCVVTVKKVEATSISINKTSVTLYIGGSDTLVTNINPSNATNKTVTWKSSNPNVASVNNGVITALSEGTATITAATANGKKVECKVTVRLNTFSNPRGNGADPWVIKYGRTYYYTYACGNDGASICISTFTNLSSLNKNNGTVVYKNNGSNVWAPELHHINGKWYIYYSVTKEGNSGTEGRRMYVISSDNPLGQYKFEGQITDSTDKWAIDGTVLQWQNQLYFLWSGWEGDINVQQNIYIAHMSNPITIDGERVMISKPEYNWEKKNFPYINEGPQVLIKNGQLYIIYSASGCWDEYYALGMLTYNGGNILSANSWLKNSTPVFQSGNGVLGTGHASFVKSPDETEDWIIYHAYADQNAIANKRRTIRLQKFTWNGNIPVFGIPVADSVQIQKPSGDR